IDLAIYTNKTLILTDFHIGYEEALNKQGLMVPRFQFPEIMKRLERIFSRLKSKKVERIIVNGDLKHEFGTISEQEWRHTLRLLDYFGQHCNETLLIKGNHDTILGPIAKKRNVRVLEHFVIEPMESTIRENAIIKKTNGIIKNNNQKSLKTINKISINNKIQFNNKNIIKKINNKNKILVIHGDKIPDKELLKDVKTVIIGHEHPAVSIKEGPRAELFKAFLVGRWKKYDIIVQPSFNLVVEGTDVLKEEVLSPFLKGNLRNFDVIVVADKLYRFGKLKDL
ncbi:MAG: metallophosphoesterase, partial [Nanoarchaeota archaeon]